MDFCFLINCSSSFYNGPLEKNGDIFDLQGYNVIVMSNSLAASPAVSNGDLLAQAMQQLLEQLGVPAMLKVCS
jgi:hypothetical protein